MYGEFFELSSGKGLLFPIKGLHLVGSDIRVQGMDHEWYRLKKSASLNHEWVMMGYDWIDFCVVSEPELDFTVITWELAKAWLIPE